MNKAHLRKTSIQADGSGAKPEDAQHLGDDGGGHQQVGGSQHGQEEEHGRVQAGISLYQAQEGAVPSKRDEVQDAEGDGHPEVKVLQPWDAREVQLHQRDVSGVQVGHGGHCRSLNEESPGAQGQPYLGHIQPQVLCPTSGTDP